MKTGQLALALVLLVGVIFGVTFIAQYRSNQSPPEELEGDDPGETQAPHLGRLTFGTTQYPQTKIGRVLPPDIESELYQEGHRDFWFENTTDKPIRVGVDSKGCKCYKVDLCIAPKEWRYRLAQVGEGPRGPKEDGVLADMVSATAGRQLREQLAAEAQNENRFVPLLRQNEEGRIVPPKGFGFVRLTWEGKPGNNNEEQRPLTVSATLWMHALGSGIHQTLQAKTILMDPVRVLEKRKAFGRLRENEKREIVFRFWSSTRPDFKVNFDLKTSPLIQISSPQPLTRADREKIQEKCKCQIRSGYRVMFTFRERSEDGSRFAQGPYRREIKVTPVIQKDGKPTETIPLRLTVLGRVMGNFEVRHPSGDGQINLGQFSASDGTATVALVVTELTGKELKLVEHPKGIQVKLSPSKLTESGAKAQWKLRVVVPPKSLSGTYDDFIVLKVQDKVGQLIRIPVRWKATR